MNRSYTPYLTIFLIFGLALLFLLSLESPAATFSGRVVDEAGEPVPDFLLILSPFAIPTWQDLEGPMMLPPREAMTDAAGEFVITDITAPTVQLMFSRNDDDRYELRRAAIEGVTFYINKALHLPFKALHLPFNKFVFAIAPEADLKNVELTVRPQMRIRGRVVFEDGTPLRGAEIGFNMSRRSVDGNSSGKHSSPQTLDAEGYFVKYLSDPDSAYYIISISYERQWAESEEILLEAGQRHDDLVLTFPDKPNPKPVQPIAPRFERGERVPIQRERMLIQQERMRAVRELDRQGVWAVNPENRHAYKRIRCETRQEAHDRAREEGAHLVAINDAAEQAWLIKVFGEENFWIGLTDAEGAENPRWDNDEPVTYANWSATQQSQEEGSDTPNYVVLVGMTGEWQHARQGSTLSRFTERAILEKPHFSPGIPE